MAYKQNLNLSMHVLNLIYENYNSVQNFKLFVLVCRSESKRTNLFAVLFHYIVFHSHCSSDFVDVNCCLYLRNEFHFSDVYRSVNYIKTGAM